VQNYIFLALFENFTDEPSDLLQLKKAVRQKLS